MQSLNMVLAEYGIGWSTIYWLISTFMLFYFTIFSSSLEFFYFRILIFLEFFYFLLI